MRKLSLACAAACAVAAIGPASALAADAKVRQNTAKTNAALNELKAQLASLSSQVAELKSTTDGLAFIAGAAPQIVDGLTQLKTGLETLAGAYQAVEYGVVRVNVQGGGTLVNPPSWSPDIPDDGNGATTGGTATLIHIGGPRAVNVTLNAYVRSNEADASGPGPVAQGGGTLTVRDENGAFVPCANHAATGGAAITGMTEPIQTPDGPITGQPLTNIMSGKPRTDQSLPGSDAPELVSCQFTTGAGAPLRYTIEYTATFLDIPTTTSPGPRD
jgi:hypothetical protein